MSLPPLFNLFAFHSPDPELREVVRMAVTAGGMFGEAAVLSSGWLVGRAPLPGRRLEDSEATKRGLFFVEGGESIVGPGGCLDGEFCDALAARSQDAPGRLAEYPGDFGFVSLAKNGATVVRSCGGSAPFHVCRGRNWSAIATRMEFLVRFVPGRFSYDPLVNALWASGWTWFPDHRTFFREVFSVERGGFARLDEFGVRFGDYWDPRPSRPAVFSKRVARDRAEEFREALIRRLERDLDDRGGNLLSLSGGVDSASLGDLAVRTCGRQVSTMSVLPEDDRAYEREMSFIASLGRRCGFRKMWEHRISQESYLESMERAPRTAFHLTHPVLCLLEEVLFEEPFKVLFGGEFADQLCGSVTTLPDLVDDASWEDFLRNLGEPPFVPGRFAVWLKHRLRRVRGKLPSMSPLPSRLPGMFDQAIHEDLEELRHRRLREALADDRPWRHLAALSEMDGWVAMNWEAASALGVRRSFPFFNREMIELAFRRHPAEMFGSGPKRALREALSGRVGEINLRREDKGGWGRYLNGMNPWSWNGGLTAGMQALLRPECGLERPKEIDFNSVKILTRLMVFERGVQESTNACRL